MLRRGVAGGPRPRPAAGLPLRRDLRGEVVISTWSSFDAIVASGIPLDRPVSVPDAQRFVTAGHADHYELLSTETRGIPVMDTRLRITSVPLRAEYEAVYFERLRRIVERLIDQAGLVAFLVGRRTIETTVEAVTISLWEHGAAGLTEPAAANLAGALDELREYYAAGPAELDYDGLALAPPHESAAAIMLVDDERRFLSASPAAAQLTGYSTARLLSMRIEDLTAPDLRSIVPEVWARFLADGSMTRESVIVRADGSLLPLRLSAKARSPWPGCHAYLVVPAATPGELDVDRALVEAGMVSRFLATG